MAKFSNHPGKRKTGWAFVCASILIASGAAWFYSNQRSPAPTSEVSPNQNIFIGGLADQKLDEQLLKTLSWNEVVATAEGVAANKRMREEVATVAGKMSHPPALYLGGLLLMAANDLQAALAIFLLIPPTEVPATLQYAPYRLHNALRPSRPNPFLPAINRAVSENRVPPLIQARVFAAEGRYQDAFKAYLKTDPAEWSDVDLRALRGFRMHAGLANDTAAMLVAALKAGRVSNNLRSEVVELIKAPRDKASQDKLKEQLLQQMKTNPEIRRAAISGAEHQLALRQRFLNRKYRELLNEKAAANAVDLPDETVLMLVLSSAQVPDVPAFDRWSQELQRRYPTPEIAKWLEQLRILTR